MCDRRQKYSPLRHFISTRKKDKFFSLLFAVVPFARRKKIALRRKKKRIIKKRNRHLNDRDRTDQDYKDPQDGKILSSSKILPRFQRGNFFYRFAPRNKSAFAPQVFSKKNIVKERTTNRKRNVYTERGMSGETTRRERRGMGKDSMPLYVRYAWVSARVEMIKRDVRSDGCSLSPRIVRRCRAALFTFPVPRSPFFELHAPNPTSDPHKGRRGRNTFGKSSATPLQRIRRVSQKSLVPRYVCFSDSLGSGAQAERETDASRV